MSVSSISKVTDWNLSALEQQIKEDVQPLKELADKVVLATLYIEYCLFDNASPDIDIFDYEKNVKEDTQVLDAKSATEISGPIESFSNSLRSKIETIQKMADGPTLSPEINKAVRFTVTLFKDGNFCKTFSYVKK